MPRRTNEEIRRELDKIEKAMRERERTDPINECQIGVERLYGTKAALHWALGEDVARPSRAGNW